MLTPIKNEQQYDVAVGRIYELMQMDLREGSELYNELDVLSLFVKEYDAEHYPALPPHPIEAIKFRLEQMNITEADLSKILGARSRKSEILSGKRKLTLAMIRKLHDKLSISADVLVQDYWDVSQIYGYRYPMHSAAAYGLPGNGIAHALKSMTLGHRGDPTKRTKWTATKKLRQTASIII